MDIPVTLLCVFLVYGLVKWSNEITERAGANDNGIIFALKIPLAVLFGVGVALILAQTDFASSQEFFGSNLAKMNAWSQVVVGVVLGFGAVGLDTTFKTVRNVGENT